MFIWDSIKYFGKFLIIISLILVYDESEIASAAASNPTSTINVDADVGGSGSISNPSCSQDAVVPVQMTTGPSSLTLAPVANQPSSSQAQGESFTVPITTEESPDGDQASSSLDQTLDLNQALRNLATEDTGNFYYLML